MEKICKKKSQLTIERLRDYLIETDNEDSILFFSPDYITAVIGVSTEGNVIYDYDRMVEYLINAWDITEEDAIDFLEYNTIGSIPTMEGKRPIIMYHYE